MQTLTERQTTTELEQFMQQLMERKAELEQQRSAQEDLQVVMKEKWEPRQLQRKTAFTENLSKMKQLVKLELALIESIKDFIDPEITSQLKAGLTNVRKSNNLLTMNGVALKYKDNVKVRQVIKLVNAVYRYNRDSIWGYAPSPVIKSRIKHATACPHCGEISMQILINMEKTKAVLLP